MATTISFKLPSAFCKAPEARRAANVAMIAKAEKHLLALAKQECFFQLRSALKDDYPSLRAFTAEMGSHYNDEGYSDHVNIAVEFVDEDGDPASAESDEEYGSLPEEAEHLDGFRRLLRDLPSTVFTQIEGQRIDCSDERELASAVMGPEGFAAFEAETINRAAKNAKKKSVVKPRL